ncbi:MAG: DUF3025 domain-containing protein [Variovorax sp.]
MTAHALWAPGVCRATALKDADIAAARRPEHFATKHLAPLPVLCAPGWWAAHESPAFSDDARIFRPRISPA